MEINKFIKTTVIGVALVFIICLSAIAAEQSSGDRTEYLIAVSSLRNIESYFSVKKPLYLTDGSLKKDLQIKIQSVIKIMEHSREVMKDWKNFYFDLGKAYYISTRLGLDSSYDKANACFIEEIKGNPSNYGARVLLAEDYMKERKYREAIDQYEYLRKNNLFEEALKLKGLAELYARKFDEGKQDLQAYLKSHPDDKHSRVLIYAIDNGKIEEHLRKHEEAIKKDIPTE